MFKKSFKEINDKLKELGNNLNIKNNIISEKLNDIEKKLDNLKKTITENRKRGNELQNRIYINYLTSDIDFIDQFDKFDQSDSLLLHIEEHLNMISAFIQVYGASDELTRLFFIASNKYLFLYLYKFGEQPINHAYYCKVIKKYLDNLFNEFIKKHPDFNINSGCILSEREFEAIKAELIDKEN